MTIKQMPLNDQQFYPTPPALAEKMLDGVDFSVVDTILEPSVGKADLVLAAARKHYTEKCSSRVSLDVDAVEIDPYLREIAKYNFSKGKANEYWRPYRDLDHLSYRDRTEEQNREHERLRTEAEIIESVDFHLVHDDFLSYQTYKHYDLILMNPPFKDGDRHLLKALQIQEHGGTIVCLLNAETLRNPHTATRKLLQQKLTELDAKIEFVENAFGDGSCAERSAYVDVVIVKVSVPIAMPKSDLFDRMKKASEEKYIPDPEITSLVPGDFIDRALCLYQAEVSATMKFVREYFALKPYMNQSFIESEYNHSNPILSLAVNGESTYKSFDLPKYIRSVRLKYWRALFHNESFMGRLTSNLRDEFSKQVNKMENYEFSAFNIKQVLVEMNASMQEGVRQTILGLFDKLSAEHSWYPECAKNRHYFNGWATNKAHKVGMKCIIPSNGLFSSYSWSRETFDIYKAYSLLSDIEKALDYLNGDADIHRYNLRSFLDYANRNGQTRNIDCTYFKVDMFKKGTVHIKFRPEAQPLVDKLNIYAARGKNWLPPCYGRKKYEDMTTEEKGVIDSFQGEEAYAKVMLQGDYYLSDPAASVPMLVGNI